MRLVGGEKVIQGAEKDERQSLDQQSALARIGGLKRHSRGPTSRRRCLPERTQSRDLRYANRLGGKRLDLSKRRKKIEGEFASLLPSLPRRY